MPEQTPEPQYTIVHPATHKPYHTDLSTAKSLHDVREIQPAYDAVFESARRDGRLHDGVAPAVRQQGRPHAPGAVRTNERTPFEKAISGPGHQETRASVDSNGTAPRVEYGAQSRNQEEPSPVRDRGAEPSVTD